MAGSRAGVSKELAGVRVAAVGLRYDEVAIGVHALLAAGAHVAAFDVCDPYDEEPLQEDVEAELERCRSFGERFHLSRYGPRPSTWREIMDSAGPGQLFDEAVDLLGGVDAFYLGEWWGWVDHEIARQLLDRLDAAGGGELVATEGSGQRVARATLAVAEVTASPVSVLREPGGRGTGAAPPNAAKVARTLVRAGWAHVTARSLHDEAMDLRADGSDRLAGAAWAHAGGMLGFFLEMGSGSSGDRCLPTVRAEDLPSHPVRLRSTNVSFTGSNADGCWLETTSEGDQIVGVRAGWEIDSFDEGESYRRMGSIDLSDGALVFRQGDTAALGPSERTMQVATGTWAVEEALGEPDAAGYRLRWAGRRPHPNRADQAHALGTDWWSGIEAIPLQPGETRRQAADRLHAGAEDDADETCGEADAGPPYRSELVTRAERQWMLQAVSMLEELRPGWTLTSTVGQGRRWPWLQELTHPDSIMCVQLTSDRINFEDDGIGLADDAEWRFWWATLRSFSRLPCAIFDVDEARLVATSLSATAARERYGFV